MKNLNQTASSVNVDAIRDIPGGAASLGQNGKTSIDRLPLVTSSGLSSQFLAGDGSYRTLIVRPHTYSEYFANSALFNGVHTINHGLSSQVNAVVISDNTNRQVIPDEIQFGNDNSLNVTLSSFQPIAGWWRAVVVGTEVVQTDPYAKCSAPTLTYDGCTSATVSATIAHTPGVGEDPSQEIRLYRSTNNFSTSTLLTSFPSVGSPWNFVDSTVSEGTSYKYRANSRALSGLEHLSDWSNTLSVRTSGAGIPEAPAISGIQAYVYADSSLMTLNGNKILSITTVDGQKTFAPPNSSFSPTFQDNSIVFNGNNAERLIEPTTVGTDNCTYVIINKMGSQRNVGACTFLGRANNGPNGGGRILLGGGYGDNTYGFDGITVAFKTTIPTTYNETEYHFLLGRLNGDYATIIKDNLEQSGYHNVWYQEFHSGNGIPGIYINSDIGSETAGWNFFTNESVKAVLFFDHALDAQELITLKNWVHANWPDIPLQGI